MQTFLCCIIVNEDLFVCLIVVTVDGILLTKSGTMTGGTSGGMEARSKQWDDKKVEGLCGSCLKFVALFMVLLTFTSL